MKLCVYTAIFGGYTELKKPYIPIISDPRDATEVTLTCFTDNPDLAPNGWEIQARPQTFFHPRMDSKWFRMNPHIELSEFDVTIWVDASFQLGDIRSFVEECLAAMRSETPDDYGSALFVDPECSDIYQEAEYSLQVWPNKYRDQPMREQVAHYREAGLPSPHRMYAGGIHVRDNRIAWTHRMNLLWFAECVKWSYQDQLSLPFVLWKIGKPCTVIPGNVYHGNNWIWAKGADR
jgi:hypothetical protein